MSADTAFSKLLLPWLLALVAGLASGCVRTAHLLPGGLRPGSPAAACQERCQGVAWPDTAGACADRCAGAMVLSGRRCTPTDARNGDLCHETHAVWGATSMTICLIVLLICVLVGIGTAFLGLMFHHERRYREQHPESETSAGRRGHAKT